MASSLLLWPVLALAALPTPGWLGLYLDPASAAPPKAKR